MQNNIEGFGYTPGREKIREVVLPPVAAALPPKALIDASLLPPVGTQGSATRPGWPSSCCAWASTYGLATWYAAAYHGLSPSDANNQASPAHIYIQVLTLEGYKAPSCGNTSYSYYFDILAQGGTVSMAQAPYTADCSSLWNSYAAQDKTPNPAFSIPQVYALEAGDLKYIKAAIVLGMPVAFAMRLYKNWFTYEGENLNVPYVGDEFVNAYHCLLIIGYSEEHQAFLVQNSQGPSWGTNADGVSGGGDCGYVWLSYKSFVSAAEKQVYYVPAP